MELIKYCQQAEVRPSNIGTGIWAKTVAKEVSGTSKAIQISSKISTGLAVAGVALDVGIGIAQNNYTQGNGTAQIGISGTAAFFSGISAERGITWDNKGNIGVYSTKSGTAMAGVSLSAGVSLTFTTAPTVEHLNGWGGSAGLSGGEGLVGGADYIFVPGDADQAFYSGGSVNIGAGVGTPAEMHVNAGKTEIKSINIFDQLYDLFDTIEKW